MSSVSQNQKTEKSWRPRPEAGEGWRRPSEWLVRKRMDNLRGALPPIRKSPSHQKDAVEFTITVTVRTSPIGYDILRRAMVKYGVKFQLKHKLAGAIEEVLREWGFPVFLYQVIGGKVSKSEGGDL